MIRIQHVVCDLLQAIRAFTTRTTPPDIVYANLHVNIQYAKAVMYFTLSLVGNYFLLSLPLSDLFLPD